MYQMVHTLFAGLDLSKVFQQVVLACDVSLQNNPKAKSLVPPGYQHTGDYPGEDWDRFCLYPQILRIPMPSGLGYYLH